VSKKNRETRLIDSLTSIFTLDSNSKGEAAEHRREETSPVLAPSSLLEA
jgi:hypothetical protein